MQEFNNVSSNADDGKSTTELGNDSLFPYLLVNIGSGVSMIEVSFLLHLNLVR